MSGTPVVEVKASVNDVDTNFAGILVDYGARERFQLISDGIRTLETEDCWGAEAVWGGYPEEACYRQTETRVSTEPLELVAKGVLDAQNIDSLQVSTPLVPGEKYTPGVTLLPEDYVFHEGHQIGVVVLGSYSGYTSSPDRNEAEITVHFDSSRIQLPVVGGRRAAVEAGL